MKKSFLSKPITWGGLVKLSIGASIVSVIISEIYFIIECTTIPAQIVDWFWDKFHKETNGNQSPQEDV